MNFFKTILMSLLLSSYALNFCYAAAAPVEKKKQIEQLANTLQQTEMSKNQKLAFYLGMALCGIAIDGATSKKEVYKACTLAISCLAYAFHPFGKLPLKDQKTLFENTIKEINQKKLAELPEGRALRDECMKRLQALNVSR
jgi:hypothetical protein